MQIARLSPPFSCYYASDSVLEVQLWPITHQFRGRITQRSRPTNILLPGCCVFIGIVHTLVSCDQDHNRCLFTSNLYRFVCRKKLSIFLARSHSSDYSSFVMLFIFCPPPPPLVMVILRKTREQLNYTKYWGNVNWHNQAQNTQQWCLHAEALTQQ